ncbi:unnamed protein product, partial [Heterosigma akashiwo]
DRGAKDEVQCAVLGRLDEQLEALEERLAHDRVAHLQVEALPALHQQAEAVLLGRLLPAAVEEGGGLLPRLDQQHVLEVGAVRQRRRPLGLPPEPLAPLAHPQPRLPAVLAVVADHVHPDAQRLHEVPQQVLRLLLVDGARAAALAAQPAARLLQRLLV